MIYSIIVTATIDAADQDEAENELLALLLPEAIDASPATVLRATVHADNGVLATKIHTDLCETGA